MPKIGAITHKGVCVSSSDVVLIVARYVSLSETTPNCVAFESLNVVYVRNIVKQFVDEFGEPDVSDKSVFPDAVWLRIQDLKSICRDLF